ncbi:ester cyclase [Streptomyces sp. UNOC14_S4]|uniref:ester cyclase n=1 Tax=Streptomyces sp. UNOC14_S4 TaxID=2872340 RepID=UPI001E48072A|nr:ester cyclase [Streptomyces sp. UNOC14_S4]MCC3767611.1 ester cyclase [Streptomyces sp. UNOC14_S4]
MTFVQVIDCRTRRYDDMSRAMDQWVDATEGRRTATHAVVGQDRSDREHYMEFVEFPSYEDAMRNSDLPETRRIFEEIVALCDGMPSFTDLDVVRDERLDKATARRFFEEVAVGGNLELIDELFTPDYHDHDIGKETDTTIGTQVLKDDVIGWRRAFDFRFALQGQLEDGDQVATRWTWRATHTGEFMGLAPTGRDVEMSGVTIFRFQDGRIAEGWWTYDLMRLARQLGAVR